MNDSSSPQNTESREKQDLSNIKKEVKPPRNFNKEISDLGKLFTEALSDTKKDADELGKDFVRKASEKRYSMGPTSDSEEELALATERKQLIEQYVTHLRIDPTSGDTKEHLLFAIRHLRKHKALRPEDIDHILAVNLMGATIEDCYEAGLDEVKTTQVLQSITRKKTLDDEIASKIPHYQVYSVYTTIDVDQYIGDQETAEREQKEQEDASGDDDDIRDQQKKEEERKLEEQKRAEADKKKALESSQKKHTDGEKKTGQKKILTRGTLTRDMDLEELYKAHGIAEMMGSRSFDLKLSSLKRIMAEFNLNQFNKDRELISIAMYLLAYFFQIPPFFDQSHTRKRLGEKEIEQMHIKEFLIKTTAFNIQLFKDDPLLKVYYPRFMEKAGWDIINNQYEPEEERDEKKKAA